MSRPYNNQQSKKEQVRTMFDAVAWRYDMLNHLLSFGIDRSWRRAVVKMVQRGAPLAILDLATGTADLAIMLAKRIPEASVTGVDLSPKMLAIGADKIIKEQLSEQITLLQGDGEELEFADESFDAVTISFGIRNFEDIDKGLSEIHRVLKPAGTLYVLEFGTPRNKIFGEFYQLYFHRVLPLLGRLLSKDSHAYRYLPESVDEFPSGERFLTLLSNAGFRKSKFKNLFGGVAQIYQSTK